MSNTKIVLNRQADLILDNAIIRTPSGLTESDIAGLVTDLAALNSTDASIESKLSVDVSTEIAARISGDASVNTLLSTETSRAQSAEASIIAFESAAMSTEVAARISGDDSLASSLSTAISNEVVARSTADATIDSALSAEISNRLAADVTFQNYLDAEESRAESVEGVLSGAISTEVSRANSAEDSLNTALSAEISARTSDVDAEQSRAESAEASLNSGLSTEISRAGSAEASLGAAVSVEQGRIDAILSASTADADQFAEIVALINSVDTTNDQAFASYVISNDAALSTEVANRESADTSLTNSLSSEASRATSAEGSLNSALSSEASRAELAEGSLDTKLSAETSRAESAEATLSSGLSSEIVARTSNDTLFETNLSVETSRAQSAEDLLRSDLSTEVVNRIADVDAEESRAMSAEASLNSSLSSEASRATSAELSLSNLLGADVSAETSRATSAEASLTARLSAEESKGTSADASLTTRLSAEESKSISVDASLASSISSNISTEVATRVSGDTSLQTQIDSLPFTDNATIEVADNTVRLMANVAAPSGGTRTFSGLINVAAQPNTLAGYGALSLVTNQIMSAADSAEASRATSAELSLTTRLSSEESKSTSADASLSTRVSIETSRATSAEASLGSAVSVEQGRIDAILSASTADADQFAEIVALINSVDTTNDQAFAGYVISNDAALSTETSRAQSAEASLDTAKLDLAGGTMSGAIDMGTHQITNVNLIGVGNLNGIENYDVFVHANLDFSENNDNRTIINLPAPTDGGDAANKTYVDGAASTAESNANAYTDTGLATKLDLAGGTMSGAIDMGNNTIENVDYVNTNELYTHYLQSDIVDGVIFLGSSLSVDGDYTIHNLPTPTNGGDATNKDYVDGEISSEVSRAESAELSLSNLLGADVSTEISRATSAEASLDSALSAEISRATSVEGTLDGKISDIISNTDLTQVDSFVETIDQFNTMIGNNFDNIYAKKNTSTQSPNGSATSFPFVNPVKVGSEQVYLNGLLLDAGDYTATEASGTVTGITFGSAPAETDKVVFYGVYGEFIQVNFD